MYKYYVYTVNPVSTLWSNQSCSLESLSACMQLPVSEISCTNKLRTLPYRFLITAVWCYHAEDLGPQLA